MRKIWVGVRAGGVGNANAAWDRVRRAIFAEADERRRLRGEEVAEISGFLVGVVGARRPIDGLVRGGEPDRDMHTRQVDVRQKARAHPLLTSLVARSVFPFWCNADRARQFVEIALRVELLH